MNSHSLLSLVVSISVYGSPAETSIHHKKSPVIVTSTIDAQERASVLKYPFASVPQLTDKEIQAEIQLLKSRISPSRITLGGSRAVPSLCEMLLSEDGWTREQTAQALGRIGDDSALPALYEMAKKKADRYESAIVAIGNIGGPTAASYLLEALPNASRRVKIEILDCLGPIGDNRAVPILCDLLQSSESVSVRHHAASALGHFRDPRSRFALQKFIKSNAVIQDKENLTESCAWDIYFAAKFALRYHRQSTQTMVLRFPADPDQSELIDIAIEKMPEPPEGIDAWLKQYEKDHPQHPLGPIRMEPTVFSFAPSIQYQKAHDELISRSKHSIGSVGIVEELVHRFLRGTSSASSPKGIAAIKMIVEIGEFAVPALENFIRHGAWGISVNAQDCLNQIIAKRPK